GGGAAAGGHGGGRRRHRRDDHGDEDDQENPARHRPACPRPPPDRPGRMRSGCFALVRRGRRSWPRWPPPRWEGGGWVRRGPPPAPSWSPTSSTATPSTSPAEAATNGSGCSASTR